MSQLNPYDSFLDGRPIDAILASTAAAIADCLEAIGPNRTGLSPAPGKWSAAEIVCHLADCEIVFAFRLRQTLAEDGPTIQPFDQEKWAARDVERLLELLLDATTEGAIAGEPPGGECLANVG